MIGLIMIAPLLSFWDTNLNSCHPRLGNVEMSIPPVSRMVFIANVWHKERFGKGPSRWREIRKRENHSSVKNSARNSFPFWKFNIGTQNPKKQFAKMLSFSWWFHDCTWIFMKSLSISLQSRFDLFFLASHFEYLRNLWNYTFGM